MKKIGITLGDINGIGTEVTIKALNALDLPINKVILIGCKENFYLQQELLEIKLNKNYEFIDVSFKINKNWTQGFGYGQITFENGLISYYSILKSINLAKKGKIDAIVTSPVSKESLNLAGFKFNGQTEILQKFLSKKDQFAQMLFVANNFRVLLLTRHIPIKDVSGYLNEEYIIKNIIQVNNFLKTHLNIKQPNIALCGLNPHAGENGLLGDEEKKYFYNSVQILRKLNVNITDPKPADTLFSQDNIKKYDLFVSCYHDQGLIPIKLLYFKQTVNLSIGLDILRSSPSHGTGFDIAGKNCASEESMINAIKLVIF